MASISQICIPAAGETFQKAQKIKTCLINMKERGEAQKYLRKNYYHRIKFIVTTFLATFMWRKHLNSETLVITIHINQKKCLMGQILKCISND